MSVEVGNLADLDNQLSALKLERKNIRSKFTRFLTYINNEENRNNVGEIKARLNKIEGTLDEFDRIQGQIDLKLKERDPGKELAEFENIYYKGISQAREMLETRESFNATPTSIEQSNNQVMDIAFVQRQSNDTTNVRLPRLDLPSFNGAYHAWLTFYDSFKALIHDNKQLADVQKLHYLRSCLRDEAAKVINSLETSSANYNVAWDLLKERYDNRRIIVQNHIKNLMELPSSNKESATNIRNLLDNVQMHLRALAALGEPVDQWDSILIYIFTSKLDRYTHREWEKNITGKAVPKLEVLLEFLRNRYQVLEASTFENTHKMQSYSHASNNIFKKQSLAATQSKDFCNFCKGEHKIFVCDKFQALSTAERATAVKTAGLCFNCLRKGHRSSECTLKNCKKCNKMHHTLLHYDDTKQINPSVQSLQSCMHSQVLLSTAMIDIHDKNYTKIQARVVLDSGSQSNFITERLTKLLQLSRTEINIPVEGLNQLETRIKHSVSTQITSKNADFTIKLDFLVIPQICNKLPLEFINRSQLEIPRNIKLADPEFHKPAEIDALLGAEIFYELLSVGQVRLSNHNALLQKTKLGWVLAGKVGQSKYSKRSKCYFTLDQMHNQMSQFWEIEELPVQRFFSPEEVEVENHFKKNVERNSDGTYVVRLPFNDKIQKLGSSYKTAEKRLIALERKFKSNDTLKLEYVKFMREYEELGHMTKVEKDQVHDAGYFLPHHAVIKDGSNTTKVRVVYDGSAKSDSGISLNDTLMVGPTIQQSLFDIVLRSRTHQIIISADIEKMYRMINVHKDDSKFQRIIWREDTSQDFQVFELNTVAYGTASAPYLAIRVLHELAENEWEKFPKAAEIVKRDFYVDDIFTGADTREEALCLRDDLNNLLKLGGFKLRQWCSNDLELISSLPENLKNVKLLSDSLHSIKTLGIQWDPRNDLLMYTVDKFFNNTRITKRNMLSQIAQLFDPIGLLGPVLIKAKILMQRLWQIKCDWDESVPPEIHTAWLNYRQELGCLNELRFQRCVVIKQAINIQIHGFCDASEVAYGACIYIRSRNENNEISVKLLCAKTRVAPLKSITIPRLELCAALLLANLLRCVQKTLNLQINNIFLWSDSSITLQWIYTQPHLLKTFVANRVSQIQSITNPSNWKHVSTKQNPADFSLRGQMPREFMQNSMWTTGPDWLNANESHWPCEEFVRLPCSELKGNITLLVNKDASKVHSLNVLTKFSSLDKTKRVMALCMRFIMNVKIGLKSKGKSDSILKSNSKKIITEIHLSIEEMRIAMTKILILLQKQFFMREINALTNKSDLHRSSDLLSLNPFLDNDCLIRLGGRLKNSILPYNERHPIVLPKAHHITTLIIRAVHLNNHHSGAQATLNAVRAHYWPINGMSTVKTVIKSCVTCFRAKPANQNYLMGNLPKERITQSRPFINTGVDYCGPFFIKEKKHRNRSKVKAYVAVFVCFATKACHLELVSDLTTETFLGCLKRFFARRGKSTTIFSDNGTNFVGANNELTTTLRELLRSETHNTQILTFLEKQGIKWNFIPPRSPHFGGLWKAAVKSFKYHFHRSIGEKLFSFEELSTYITEIEAILNSRPITPLSSDPNDLRSLCPSHFLIGDSLMSVPEHDLSEIAVNRLSNWQNVQRIKQYFWKRWYKEYLNQLNIRSKWQRSDCKPPEVGSMVLVREDNVPPLRWPLGRIVEIHPGNDSVVRVVTVRTQSGTYKRSVKRIAPLPLE